MLHTDSLINAFEKLGQEMTDYCHGKSNLSISESYNKIIRESHAHNPWFIPEYVKIAIANIGDSLTRGSLEKWLLPYDLKTKDRTTNKTIGIVMAGNVPLVGFHDFLSVIFSGNKVLAKLSSDDNKLLPFLASRLYEFYPEIEGFISFTDDRLQDFDAIIATGSNNTSRYFEYYFGKYPHIIRKNRNGVGVISGDETAESFIRLGEDVFLYFGLGCRNTSKLYVPVGYDFSPMLKVFEDFTDVANHNKFRNNYDYYRSIYLINKVKHLDNGVIMVTQNSQMASPLSVLYFEEYNTVEELNKELKLLENEIQCIGSDSMGVHNAIPFGQSQKPELWDYADGVDTMAFLAQL